MAGLPFKVLVVVSFMPVAFNALVPPALYGFDLDLANSAWIVTTLALLVIVPGLYLVLGFLCNLDKSEEIYQSVRRASYEPIATCIVLLHSPDRALGRRISMGAGILKAAAIAAGR